MSKKIAIGIDIGGTNTKIAAVAKDATVIGYHSFPTGADKPFEQFVGKIDKQVKKVIEEIKNHDDKLEVAGVGIGAPNANPVHGTLKDPPNLSWGTVPIKDIMEEKLQLKVYLDNDANVAALGEGTFGVAKDMKDYIAVTLGTGVGTGIVVNNKILSGANGMAGEGGHIMIVPEGRCCGCGGSGHLEAYASGTGLQKTAKEIFRRDITGKEVGDLFHKEDPEAMEVFDKTARWLGQGLASMGTLFAPEAFILAGGVAAAGDNFRKLVEFYVNEYVYPSFKGEMKVLISAVSKQEGAVLGAASLVYNALENEE